MPITSQASADGQNIQIKVDGRFDFSTYEQFRAAYKQAAGAGTRYVIDMRQTEYMDSSALGMLLLLRERSGGDNADIKIINCNPEIRQVFRIAQFERLFDIS
jgi:anti-anti-sigma factor